METRGKGEKRITESDESHNQLRSKVPKAPQKSCVLRRERGSTLHMLGEAGPGTVAECIVLDIQLKAINANIPPLTSIPVRAGREGCHILLLFFQ